MSCVMWKNELPLLLLSIYANLTSTLDKLQVVAPHRNRVIRKDIPTSPILVEYIKYMRGVDVANQLCKSYSGQTRSYK